MKLIRLRLENFRQHADSTIDFRDGMTAIVGPNGSGKSTILEAITFALYGEQRNTKDTVRFYWAPPRKKFRVELTFEFDGKKYQVERGETDASLTHMAEGKDHLMAQSLKAVTTACERLISLNYEQFTNSFCAEQKGLSFLEFKTKTARQDEIARMLGYDRLKQAASLGKTRAKEFKDQIVGMERLLGDEAELKAQIEIAKSQTQIALQSVRAGEDRIAALDAALPKAASARKTGERFLELLNQSRTIAAKAEGLKAAVKMSEKSLEDARLEAVELTSIKPLEAQYQESEAAVKTWDAQREKHLAREETVKRLNELKVELTEIQLRLKTLGTPDVSALEANLETATTGAKSATEILREAETQWREQQQSAKSLLDRCEERLSSAEAQLKKAKDLIAKGICPECGQSTTASSEQLIEAKQAEIAELQAEQTTLAKVLTSASAKPQTVTQAEADVKATGEVVESTRVALSEAKATSARIATETERATTVEIRIKQHTEELAAMPSTYDEAAHRGARAKRDGLQADHARFLKIEHAEAKVAECTASNEAARQQLDVARTAYRVIDDEKKTLGLTDESARAAVEAHTQMQGERNSAERDLTGAKQMHDLHAKALQEKESQLANLKKQEAHIRETRNALELHETTCKELLALRERLNDTIRPDLEARAADNLGVLTHGRYAVMMLDENFQATVIEDEVAKPVISGGEEDVVALSLRLALSELIQERQGRPMSLLILDEVFGSLDSDRRQSVLDRLSAIKGRFNQILVISHIEEINQVADQCLYVSREAESKAARVTDTPADFALVSPL